jgi:anti-sigma factor (TIGR02949 family)
MSDETEKIECEEAIRRMLEYLDNELDQNTNELLETHLHTCRSCFSRLEFEQLLKQMVNTVPKEKIPQYLKDRIKKITDTF